MNENDLEELKRTAKYWQEMYKTERELRQYWQEMYKTERELRQNVEESNGVLRLISAACAVSLFLTVCIILAICRA